MERRAQDAARALTGDSQVDPAGRVQPATAPAAQEVLDGFDASYSVQRSPGRVGYVIANPEGLAADEHPFARLLPAAPRGCRGRDHRPPGAVGIHRARPLVRTPGDL